MCGQYVCEEVLTVQNFAPEVKDRASIYVPAIGKVTITVLLRNLLRIVQNREATNNNSPAIVNGQS